MNVVRRFLFAVLRELECHVVAVVRAFVAKLDCFLANVGDG